MAIANVVEQDRLLRLLPAARRHYTKIRGVINVEVGFKFTGREMTNLLCFVVYVSRKFDPELLLEENLLRPTFKNVPIDVVAIQPKYNNLSRVDPLIGGISVSNTRFGSWGTVGCYVKDNTTSAPLGLTNYHVIVDTGEPFQKKGKIGDHINQPGLQPDTPEYNVGTLLRFDRDYDCAVFGLNDSRSITQPPEISQTVGVIGSPVAACAGMLVKKVGAASELTYGVVTSISSAGFTVGINPEKRPANDIISTEGDSGSVWISDDTQNNILGLHYGGDTTMALAHRIEIVFARLGISL